MKYELRLVFAYTMTRLFDALNVSWVELFRHMYLPFAFDMCQTLSDDDLTVKMDAVNKMHVWEMIVFFLCPLNSSVFEKLQKKKP